MFSRPIKSETSPEMGRVMPFAKLSIETASAKHGSRDPEEVHHPVLQAEIARDRAELRGHRHAAEGNQQID
jgi:hypothetical protein